MLTFILVAVIFAVVVVGLFMYNKAIEGAREQIQQLENARAGLESEKLRLTGRLETCESKVRGLEQQLEESEQARLDLAKQLREKR